MVPMHGKNAEGAFHEPARPSNLGLPWESGAEDARTPDADAWSADSAAREAFGVCLIRHGRSAVNATG